MINIIDIFYRLFERPYVLLIYIPILIGLWYLINKDFIELLKQDAKKRRRLIFLSRAVILLLLLIALAAPFVEKSKTIQGDPRIKILLDNSSSMQLYDLNVAERLKTVLENKIPTELEYISSGDKSPIADYLIANMKKNENILLISDGNNNIGVELGDVVLKASILNSTINTINLKSINYDTSISITGSDKIITGVENTFIVNVKQTEKKQVRVLVDIDGQNIINQITDKNIEFKRSFREGYHRITAKIDNADYFSENSIYYKTIKVVPKPKVFIYGTEISDIKALFEPVYDVTVSNEFPDDLKKYITLVIVNQDAEMLNDKTSLITDFVAEGNGLYVVGGGNSFDSGNYKGSKFEQILPVYVAKAGRKKGEVNLVFVIDVSGSTGHKFGSSVKSDVEKALAIDMIQNLSIINNVGVVAFNTLSYKISDVKPLIQNKIEIVDLISRLKYNGGTSIGQGIGMALELLEGKGGSKNIILISDGRNQDYDESRNAALTAGSKGIRIYTVGVGDDTMAENMLWFAEASGGTYFEPGYTDRIRVLFGDTQVVGNRKVFPIMIIDNNHFITKDLKVKANLYGFNQVVASSNGKILISTDVGDPVLVVGRLGLGRIATLSTDYKLYGFELLGKDSSLMTTRTMNWLIGDPERKNENYINIPDIRKDEEVEITIRADEQPVSDKVVLYKIDDKIYRGNMQVDKIGFNSIVNAVFAVNYNREYQDILINPELENIVKATNGKIFDENEIDEIVEHVRLRSRREELKRISYAWIFVGLALLIYLIEVCIRRLIRNKTL